MIVKCLLWIFQAKIFLKKFIKLQKDKYFLGGAITTPYKEDIAKLLKNRLTPEAKKLKQSTVYSKKISFMAPILMVRQR